MKKKLKITFLLDKNNDWIQKSIKKTFLNNQNKYFFSIKKNYKKVINQDIVFILSYTKILPKSFLKKNKLNLVIHASNLPKGKGFAPIQWQILDNKNKIKVCLIEAALKVDSGPILEENYLKFKGNELNDEIREMQSNISIKIIKKFLKKYPKVKKKSQIGKSSYYKRRYPLDSLLNINKSIKKNFNLLRIVDNEKYPAFFTFKKKKYIIKIFKINKNN